MSSNTFGQYIRRAREKKALTQSELGNILGVTNKAVSKWENGSAYPSGDLIYPLSEAIGITTGI